MAGEGAGCSAQTVITVRPTMASVYTNIKQIYRSAPSICFIIHTYVAVKNGNLTGGLLFFMFFCEEKRVYTIII